MTTQNKNVPAIRFPEFVGDWKKEKIEPYLKLYVERVKADTDIPILTSSRNGLFLQKDYFDNRELDNDGEYGVVPKGYFTYRHMSDDSTFKFNINNLCDKGAVSKEYPVFTTQEMESFFLQLKLNHGEEFKRFAIAQKRGGTRTRLYFNRLIQLNLSIPTLPEQQKIAAFFKAVDEKVQQLDKKKDLLEQYKKGVMQKILNQEIRFKDNDGNDFADWEEKQLNELLTEHKTRNSKNEYEEVFSVAKNKGVINQIEHLGRSYASEVTSNYKVVFPNDIVYTKSPTADFPFGIIKQNKTNRTGIVSVLYAVYRPINKDIGTILDYYFSSPVKTYNYLNPLVHKGAKNTMNIGNNEFINGAQISLPVSEKEQEKIADLLSLFNEKIDLANQQLEKTKEYKKGLLQQMFI